MHSLSAAERQLRCKSLNTKALSSWMVTTGQIFRVLLAPLNFFPLKLVGVNALRWCAWAGFVGGWKRRVNTGDCRTLRKRKPEGRPCTHSGGWWGCRLRATKKPFLWKLSLKKKTKNYFYHLWSTNVNFLISAFIIYNCPKKLYNRITWSPLKNSFITKASRCIFFFL